MDAPARRALLERLHAAAIAAALPGPAVAAACARLDLPAALPGPAVAAACARLDLPAAGTVHVLAVGKAAPTMAAAAVAALAARGVAPGGGLVVGAHETASPHPALVARAGDHPVPGARSRAAADALGAAAARVRADDLALVLLSGGASALVGAPVASGIDLAALTAALLAGGVPIDLANAVRKRCARWGAGRLAAALAPARVACLAVSDVPGDDVAVIGSGPCTPDGRPRATLDAALAGCSMPAATRTAIRRALDAAPRPPAADHPAFARTRTAVIAGNADARRGAAAAARAAGCHMVPHDDAPLAGEAAPLGRALADALVAAACGGAGPPATTLPAVATVHVWGGEPTVTLDGAGPDAAGGRLQALALAAAGRLAALATGSDAARASAARRVTLLAGSTDGRDGPTDAAGAVVDATTWAAIAAAGRDPAADLAAHRSHPALDAAGALLRTGPTGTNVADVVLGLVAPR